jgi:hypothetical protein
MKSHPDKTALSAVIVLLMGASGLAPAAEPPMSWLENEAIKVGVDLSLGGAITWLSKADGENRVNNFDHGRQIQLSYFSGPVPFETAEQKPSDHWRHLGWNPIQAGDDFRNGSEVIEHRKRRPRDLRKISAVAMAAEPGAGGMFLRILARARGIGAEGAGEGDDGAERRDAVSRPAPRVAGALCECGLSPGRELHGGASPLGRGGGGDAGFPDQNTHGPLWIGTEQWSALLDEKG